MQHHILRRIIFLGVMFLLLSAKTFSQKSFIVTNDNEKIIVDDSSFEIQLLAERIAYKNPNSQKNQIMHFKNIKKAVLGDYNLSRIKIAEEKEDKLYFTIAETSEKSMVGYNSGSSMEVYSPHNEVKQVKHKGDPHYGYETKTTTKYLYYIIDNNNKVIEKLKCLDTYGEKFAKERNKVEETIKRHFSDCPDLMARLAEHDLANVDIEYSKRVGKIANRLVEGNYNLIKFFEKPKYTNCSQTKSVTSKTEKTIIKANNDELNMIPNQKYNVGKLTTILGAGSKTTDLNFKGTLTIKDGFLYTVTKDVSVKNKVISYDNATLKYADRDMIHTMIITAELGKIKGFAYDTKITFIADDKMGGATSYYWCTKNGTE